MSRVAKNPISVPSGIEINLNEKTISVSGAKGKSEFAFPDTVSATLSDDLITVCYDESSSESTALAVPLDLLLKTWLLAFLKDLKKHCY